jgi:excisionase family DNA binding protein
MTTDRSTAGTAHARQTARGAPEIRLLSCKEVADMLGVGERWIRKITTETGELPYYRVGSRVRVSLDDALAYLEARRVA